MKKIILLNTMLFSTASYAGFEFGECSGSGSFEQQIVHYGGDYDNDITVGTIPQGIKNLKVTLQSDRDVDIRIYGNNNEKVVHWPNGILHASGQETKAYKGINVTYSGYNGIGGSKGHESIEVDGYTPTAMTMKAFGYKAGYAIVHYSWTGKEGCTTKTSGSGSFTQKINQNTTSLVGTIPMGVKNLRVNLTSDKDLDIQLFSEDGTAIASWKPTGLMSGSQKQTIDYHNMNVTWSGYNGSKGRKGDEYIEIKGETTESLVMKVYGYQTGNANVEYSWGNGATQLFASGFEEGVYLAPSQDPNSLDYNFIRGTDSVSGFSWPLDILGASESGLHYVADDGGTALKAEMQTVDGYDGKPTRAIYTSESHREREDTQLTYEILNITEGTTDLYVKFRMKIDSNMLGKSDTWRALFEYKTKNYRDPGEGSTGYRLISYVYTDDNGNPSWHFQGDKDSQNPIWECDTLEPTQACNNSFVPVITDEWFETEYYWHWSNNEDGYTVWKINGKIVGEHHGPTTRNNQPIDFILLMQLYGDVSPKYQWIDDMEIWDSMP